MAGGFTFLEFFAGGGMARLGLGPGWRALFANDLDAVKRAAYGANFGLDHFRGEDVNRLRMDDLPGGRVDLAWASSPCQDLSLAGNRGGLAAKRSGAFFGFWSLMEALAKEARAPRLIVIENVTGLLTSNGGADFSAVVARLAARGYLASALVLNASQFVPQSRPRLFIIGFGEETDAPFDAAPFSPDAYSPGALIEAAALLPSDVARNWRWLSPRPATRRNATLMDVVDASAPFDSDEATMRRLQQMAPRQRAVIERLAAEGVHHVGAAFRRVRVENGVKRSRIEARFDGLAGCVRTPAGGSSRQIIMDIRDGEIRTRLMTPREAARVMGLPEDYQLPEGATAALKLIGDGVSPPVVRWLAEAVLERALAARRRAAA
jgi:DNA (cytosine-5)-methyltransferase 1